MIILVHQLHLLAQSAFRWFLWKPVNTDKIDRRKSRYFVIFVPVFIDESDETNFPFLCDKKTICYIQKGKTMFIMRDASGSGMSTIVKLISKVYENVCLCSSDQYFMKKSVDQFDHKQLSVAHDECVEKAKKACLKGVPVVVIDNTNVERSEIGNYLNLAATNNYAVIIVKPKTPRSRDADKLAEFNKHGVTADITRGKLRAFEDVLPLYYGWFLNQQDSDVLYELGRKCLLECVTLFPQLKDLIIFQSPEIYLEIGKALDDCILKCKKWYGYHFPELKLIISNENNTDVTYARVVKKLGNRRNVGRTDLSEILPKKTVNLLKFQANISMGGEITDDDIILITDLCEKIIEMWEYKEQVEEFVKNPVVNKTPKVTKHVWEVIDEDKFEETLYQMFNLNLHRTLHCTANFMGTKDIPLSNRDKYANMPVVHRSYGAVMTFTVTRIIVTPMTIIADVKLSHHCLQLYEKPREKSRGSKLKIVCKDDQVAFELGSAAQVTIGTVANIPIVQPDNDLLDILEEEKKCKIHNTRLPSKSCSVGTATQVGEHFIVNSLDKPINLQGLYTGFYWGNFGSPRA